jgi:hypothetical protein
MAAFTEATVESLHRVTNFTHFALCLQGIPHTLVLIASPLPGPQNPIASLYPNQGIAEEELHEQRF